MNINKRFDEKKSSDISPLTALNWALAVHKDAQIVLADNGRQTMIGAKYDGETHFFVECAEDEIELTLNQLDKRPGIVNYKVAKGHKSASLDTTRKVVVTKLNPSSNILRLYWRISNPMAPGGQMDIFWCDAGRDGNMGALEELSLLLERNKIPYSDVIRKDL